METGTAAGRGGAGLDGFKCSVTDVSTAGAVGDGRNTSFSNVNFTPGVIFLRTGSELTVCSEFTIGDLSSRLLATCDNMPTDGEGCCDEMLPGETGLCDDMLAGE